MRGKGKLYYQTVNQFEFDCLFLINLVIAIAAPSILLRQSLAVFVIRDGHLISGEGRGRSGIMCKKNARSIQDLSLQLTISVTRRNVQIQPSVVI